MRTDLNSVPGEMVESGCAAMSFSIEYPKALMMVSLWEADSSEMENRISVRRGVMGWWERIVDIILDRDFGGGLHWSRRCKGDGKNPCMCLQL
jgi:hypothetical protein